MPTDVVLQIFVSSIPNIFSLTLLISDHCTSNWEWVIQCTINITLNQPEGTSCNRLDHIRYCWKEDLVMRVNCYWDEKVCKCRTTKMTKGENNFKLCIQYKKIIHVFSLFSRSLQGLLPKPQASAVYIMTKSMSWGLTALNPRISKSFMTYL